MAAWFNLNGYIIMKKYSNEKCCNVWLSVPDVFPLVGHPTHVWAVLTATSGDKNPDDSSRGEVKAVWKLVMKCFKDLAWFKRATTHSLNTSGRAVGVISPPIYSFFKRKLCLIFSLSSCLAFSINPPTWMCLCAWPRPPAEQISASRRPCHWLTVCTTSSWCRSSARTTWTTAATSAWRTCSTPPPPSRYCSHLLHEEFQVWFYIQFYPRSWNHLSLVGKLRWPQSFNGWWVDL